MNKIIIGGIRRTNAFLKEAFSSEPQILPSDFRFQSEHAARMFNAIRKNTDYVEVAQCCINDAEWNGSIPNFKIQILPKSDDDVPRIEKQLQQICRAILHEKGLNYLPFVESFQENGDYWFKVSYATNDQQSKNLCNFVNNKKSFEKNRIKELKQPITDPDLDLFDDNDENKKKE